MTWYSRITQDLSVLPDFITHYENEIISAKSDVRVYGNVEKNIAALPGITEYRFNQLQEVEAVLNFLNIQLRQIRRKHFQKYLEGYARALTSRDAEKYVDGEQEVIDLELLINEIAMVRNVFTGIIKALENKSYQLNNISKLRAAGLEDSRIE